LLNKIARLAGICAAVVCLRAAPNPGPDNLPNLVRRDLIRQGIPVFPKIRRDLFSSVAFEADLSDFAPGEDSPMSFGKKTAPATEPLPPPPPSVRYVGYVKYEDPGTPVAIILIDGRAFAVAEGETLGNGWSAVKITDKQVELRNPDGNNLVFIYEGERP